MPLNLRAISLLFFLLIIGNNIAVSQKKVQSYVVYIEQFSDLAVEHQKKYRIPASITLAQGILESGAGQGDLARRSHNHFGIKCHADWSGPRVYHDDDLQGECFRKYKHPKESYEDHSRFLTERSRYVVLFELDSKDYKGWAAGLQKCGYATDKAYANKLIKLIEDYELYRYDSNKTKKTSTSKSLSTPAKTVKRTIYQTHGLIYLFAKQNDTMEEIAANLGFNPKDLRKYNEIRADFPLQKGDIIYLEKKKKKADKPYFDHVVQIGESMHSISQKYGILIKSLYKMNKKQEDYVPEEGDVLKLR